MQTLFSNAEPTTSAPEPQNIKELLTRVGNISALNYEEFCALRDYCSNHETEIKIMAAKLTVPEIKKIVMARPGDGKDRLINSLYDGIISSFNITGNGMVQIDYFAGETYTGNVKKKFAEHTPEAFATWQAEKQAKKAAFKKAITDPETLEEFRTFVQYRGAAKLTAEQKEIYDELLTGKTKEHKQAEAERRAHITAVQVEDAELLIIETEHTKKKIPLWVVRLSERVEKHIFNELNTRAKQLGGYYSSYRGNGAVPGFTFEKKEAAELFTQIKDGDINAGELRKAINAERQQQRAENLEAKAEVIGERAEDELNRDRKDNTARRARMASAAEQKAASELLFSKYLAKIAEGMQDGTIKHLTALTTATQLEALQSILSRAKWDYINANNIRQENFEFVPEVFDFVKFPNPTLYKENALPLVYKMRNDKGKMMAANRMGKKLASITADTAHIPMIVREGRELEDFKTLFLCSSKGIQPYECERYQHQMQKYNRVIRLGITTPHELRAALRELVRIQNSVTLSPEQLRAQEIKELVRKFVGRKIDGFFPTPEKLGREVVRKAGIVEGDVIWEPSAGLGHLAEIIQDEHPENKLVCFEIYQPLHEALLLKGITAHNVDFLKCDGAEHDLQPDKIIMNPPFENLQDIDHVKQAWRLLKPGGRIVAIMAGNKDRQDRKVREFMDMVDEFGTWEQNEPGSFESAFRPTGVNTITVVLDKPKN